MTSRKIKIDSQTTLEIPEGGEHIFTSEGEIIRKGTVDEKTGFVYSVTGDTILMAGSKSSLKRMNLLERNILVLAKKQNQMEEKLEKIIQLLENKND